MLSDYDLRGILVMDSRIKGLMTRTRNPHTEVTFGLNKGQVTYQKSDLAVNNISFDGFYTNGSKNSPETSSVRTQGYQVPPRFRRISWIIGNLGV